MKKLFTLLIALFALCISSWATVTQQQIGDFWYELDDSYNVATLIKLPGSGDWASYEISGDITIPGTVNDGVSDYTVTTIGTKAFVNVGITSVTIEEGVTDINETAFFGSSLQTATLPSTITYLGNQSFDYTALTAFVITATTPVSFGAYEDPFSNVSTLEHIYVPAASVDAYKAAWSSYASLIVEKPVWITWYQTDVESVNLVAISEGETSSQTVKNITVTASSPASGDYATFSTSEYGNSISIHDGGTITFAPTSGKLKGISISCGGYASYSHLAVGSGWTWNGSKYTLEWSGEPAESVVLACDGSSDGIYFGQNTSIVFTLEAEEEPAPAVTTTTITWNAGNGLTSINLSEYTHIWSSYYNDYISFTDGDKVATIDGVTATLSGEAEGAYATFDTYDNNTSISLSGDATLTFSTALGQFESIVINFTGTDGYLNSLPGWNRDDESAQHTITWSGTPANSVVLEGVYVNNISSIEFTVTSGSASSDPVSQGPVTWDFVNDAELASIYLSQYTHYNFGGYYQEYYDDHYSDTVKNFKGIVATISAMIDDSYASFNNNNNYCIDLENGGTLTFSTELGLFQSIVINTTSYGSSSGEWVWNDTEHTLTWARTPANSVVLDNIYISNITSIVFTFVSAASASTADITWDATEVATIDLYGGSLNTVVSNSTDIDGITPSIMKTNDGYCYFDNSKIKMQNNGELIFTSSVGDIQGIVLTFDNTDSYSISDFPVGWTLDEVAGTLTWEDTPAAEVSLAGSISCTVTSIEFSVDPSTAPADPNMPTGPSFEWQWRQVNLVELYCTGLNEVQTTRVIKNVITSLERTGNSGYSYFQNGQIKLVDNGELTFKSIAGDFTGIVITGSAYTTPTNLPANWTYNSTAGTITWMGTPAEEVTLSGDIDIDITSIQFFYDPEDAPYVGTKFFGIYGQWYEITGAHTAKMPVQVINHTLQVPASVEYENETYYVTEIADNAFKNNVDLPNAYIGGNVARIGAHAFEGCYRMDEVTVTSSVLESIGDEAFKNCQLMHIFECVTNLPPELGSNVFEGDNRINHYNVYSDYVVDRYKVAEGWSDYADKIYLMFGEPDLGEVFFWSNQTTTNLYAVAAVSPAHEAKVLPYTVNDLYPRTLEGRLSIPEEVRYMNQDYDVAVIGADAYENESLISFVLIPQAVKTIEAGAFAGCTGVTNVQFLWDDLTGITWADGNVGAEFATTASGNTIISVPLGKLAAYQAWAPSWASRMVEGELLDIDVTNSQDPDHVGRYYRTFYDSQTDYLMPPSVWAHAGYVDGENFILSPVAFDGMILPRGTAVVLESETPTYRLIPMGNSAPLYDGPNDLQGTDVDLLRTDLGANADKVYVLGKKSNIGGDLRVGMGMYRYVGTTLGAHKAYMILNTSNPGSAPARFLFKREQTPTGIEDVQGDKVQCTKVIRNGQLFIIKDGKEYNAQGQLVK